tara:strand:- start:428 stop:529 length:102 start_codon:yes stop_codon:yes gene_type:complete
VQTEEGYQAVIPVLSLADVAKDQQGLEHKSLAQ